MRERGRMDERMDWELTSPFLEIDIKFGVFRA